MLYSGNSNYLNLLISALVISHIVYKYSDNIRVGKVKKEDFMSNYDSNKRNILPTMDNPFMNVQYDDYIKNAPSETISKLNNYKNI